MGESRGLIALSQPPRCLSIHPRQPNRLVTKFPALLALPPTQPRARSGKNNRRAVRRDRVCVAIVMEFARLVANQRENPNA